MVVLYALAGFAAGVLGGMGMGGGTILIPMLSVFFSLDQHVCQGINLISFVPMAIGALIVHFKNNLVEKKGVLFIIIPAVLTCIGGSFLAKGLNGEVLKRIFGAFLLLLAVAEFFGDKIEKELEKKFL